MMVSPSVAGMATVPAAVPIFAGTLAVGHVAFGATVGDPDLTIGVKTPNGTLLRAPYVELYSYTMYILEQSTR